MLRVGMHDPPQPDRLSNLTKKNAVPSRHRVLSSPPSPGYLVMISGPIISVGSQVETSGT